MQLTTMEEDLLECLASGYTMNDMAVELDKTLRQIQYGIGNLRRKLHLGTHRTTRRDYQELCDKVASAYQYTTCYYLDINKLTASLR